MLLRNFLDLLHLLKLVQLFLGCRRLFVGFSLCFLFCTGLSRGFLSGDFFCRSLLSSSCSSCFLYRLLFSGCSLLSGCCILGSLSISLSLGRFVSCLLVGPFFGNLSLLLGSGLLDLRPCSCLLHCHLLLDLVRHSLPQPLLVLLPLLPQGFCLCSPRSFQLLAHLPLYFQYRLPSFLSECLFSLFSRLQLPFLVLTLFLHLQQLRFEGVLDVFDLSLQLLALFALLRVAVRFLVQSCASASQGLADHMLDLLANAPNVFADRLLDPL